MTISDWNFTRAELDAASTSSDTTELSQLCHHESKFVRAQVAGNRHCPQALREIRSRDISRGVIGWLIGNPSLSKQEFDDIFNTSQKQGYCSVVIQALASSPLADTHQLRLLAHEQTFSIQLAILNNYRGRGKDYLELISQYLEKSGKNPTDWSEVEKLAYYRIYGSRLPPDDN
jgi:hypothetical protein